MDGYMLTLKINGEAQSFPRNTLLMGILNALSYNPQQVAVAINLTFVPRAQFETHAINDQDDIEILSAIQGG